MKKDASAASFRGPQLSTVDRFGTPSYEELEAIHGEALEVVCGGGVFNCRDADGVVPESFGFWPSSSDYAITDTISTFPCQRSIRYNLSAMAGAGPNDWARVRAHEHAHAAGWDHGEGNPLVNPAFQARFPLTGT